MYTYTNEIAIIYNEGENLWVFFIVRNLNFGY